LSWYENLGAAHSWELGGTLTADDVTDVAAADVDGDGDLDLIVAREYDGRLVWYENQGGQFGVQVRTRPPFGMVGGESQEAMRVDVLHRGRPGDHDLRLRTLAFLLEAVPGGPLDRQMANRLVDSLRLYWDDGNGQLDAVDTVLAEVDTFVSDDGVVEIPLPVDDARLRVTPDEPLRLHVVVQLAKDLAAGEPPWLRLTYLTDSTYVEDADSGAPLTQEAGADGATSFITRNAGDSNRDGRFDREDITLIAQSGKYLTGLPASWAQGDWTGDSLFDQRDLVLALQTGTYRDRPLP
jgi:hypothetical protein